MPGRALIIGIERYPRSVDLAQTIAGATASAEQFFDWLTTAKGVRAGDTWVCAKGGTFAGAQRFDTDRESIVDAMAALVAAGQDQTDELFVFFSGHGYCFQESLEKRAIDVLIAGDFESAASSGTKCIKLQEVQEKLYAILGGQHHYYFVDACRTLIHEDEIDPIGLGRRLGRPAQRGRPTKYTLYSTAYGAPAAISSDFGPALLEGLRGRGRAKGYSQAGALFVMFPLLCSYVQSRLRGQKVDQNKDGNGEGLIIEMVPVPSYTCAIAVDGASAADRFDATLTVAGNPAFRQVTPFAGPAFDLSFNPGNLLLDVLEGGQPLDRVDPPPPAAIDFFDNCRAVFRRGPRARTTRSLQPGPGDATILSAGPTPDVGIRAINLHTGQQRDIEPSRREAFPPGEYEVTVLERGVPISQVVTRLDAGEQASVGNEPLGPVRESIVHAVHGDPGAGAVSFSESLGPIANRDLGLWLTLMGASHILRDPTAFSKLKELPLARVEACAPDSSSVYLLSASAEGEEPPDLDVGGTTVRATGVPGLVGVVQALTQTNPGPALITIGFGARDIRTIASFCVPNRVTFIVCAPGSRGQLKLRQFLLPMYHLHAHLPQPVADLLHSHQHPLRVIRTAYLFQAQFAQSRPVEPVAGEDRQMWDELLYGKWIDPLMSLLACYEILRRGGEDSRDMLRSAVVPNLERYFPGIPDTAAVASLLGLDRPMPEAPPLFREGLLAFPEWDDHLPLPADRLDFNYVWTTWRGRRARARAETGMQEPAHA